MNQLLDLGTRVVWATGFTNRYAGIAAACGGDPEAASAFFEQGLELARELDAPCETVLNTIWYAWAHQLNNQGDEAQSLLTLANTEARKAGMETFAVQLARVLSLRWPENDETGSNT
jgi:hypothetical protein